MAEQVVPLRRRTNVNPVTKNPPQSGGLTDADQFFTGTHFCTALAANSFFASPTR
jgi:hypothetical protein